MESPLCELIIIGKKIQPSEGPFLSPEFKGFNQDVNIAKNMIRF